MALEISSQCYRVWILRSVEQLALHYLLALLKALLAAWALHGVGKGAAAAIISGAPELLTAAAADLQPVLSLLASHGIQVPPSGLSLNSLPLLTTTRTAEAPGCAD